jgi:hypothetical protein
MANKPKKTKKRKGKIRIKQKAAIVRKDSIRRDSVRNDTLPKVQGRPPADVAPTFRVKIRKKR